MNLEGKRILLTGASGGIGRALADEFVRAGASVLMVGRDATALQRIATEAALGRSHFHAIACDIAKAGERARLCEMAATWHGGVDVLVNNAGVAAFGLLDAQSPDEIERVLITNLAAPIDLCRRLMPRLREQREAHIVNIGSVLGSIGFAGNSVYSASKFGLRGFSAELSKTASRWSFVPFGRETGLRKS